MGWDGMLVADLEGRSFCWDGFPFHYVVMHFALSCCYSWLPRGGEDCSLQIARAAPSPNPLLGKESTLVAQSWKAKEASLLRPRPPIPRASLSIKRGWERGPSDWAMGRSRSWGWK